MEMNALNVTASLMCTCTRMIVMPNAPKLNNINKHEEEAASMMEERKGKLLQYNRPLDRRE